MNLLSCLGTAKKIISSNLLSHDLQEYGLVKQDNRRNIVNDIAIIFLPRPAELNPGVQLVCLPHNPNEYRFATLISKHII